MAQERLLSGFVLFDAHDSAPIQLKPENTSFVLLDKRGVLANPVDYDTKDDCIWLGAEMGAMHPVS